MPDKRFCSDSGCDRSSWGKDGGPCFLHLNVLPEWGWTEEIEKHAFLSYINNDAVNRDSLDSTGETLEITRWNFSEKYIHFLKDNIKRPLHFIGCEFTATDLFTNCHYEKAIEFYGCKWPADPDGICVVRVCVFDNSVRFRSVTGKTRFQKCRFARGLEIEFGAYDRPASPAAEIDDCDFSGTGVVSLRCNRDLSIMKTRFGCRAFIDGNDKKIHIQGIAFERNVTIGLTKQSDLLLAGIYMHGDMLIAGGYLTRQKPRIQFDAIHQFENSKVIFENLDLSEFVSPTYHFWNVEFHGVRFKKYRNRSGLRAEADMQRNLEQRKLNTQRAVEILEGLEESYKNIKQAYDRGADYRSGNEFHASELWAKWQVQRLGRPLAKKVFNWMVSWNPWYWLISDFGQSVVRPFAGLVFVFIIAAVSFFTAGVGHQDDAWMRNPEGLRLQEPQRISRALELACNNILLRFSPNQETLVASQFSGWSSATVHTVGGIQGVLSLICVTFFLLALRRRFKR